MGLIADIKSLGLSLVNVVVPRRCVICDSPLIDGEDVMCLHCLMKMPRPMINNYTDNLILDRLVSLKAPLEKATSLFYYQHENPYTRIIHDTKYNGRPLIGHTLARSHATELASEGFFDGIDLIIPVPLHPLKEFMRGYNQSMEIARGLSEASGIPIGDHLITHGWHGTQTRLNARQRRLNSLDRYRAVHPDELHGKHVLLVDDVITTGSTILSALEAIHDASPDTRLSVYSLALTKME